MKLIFLKDVGGVGQAGSIKDISDGYALNYLIPRGLAVQATPAAVAAHQDKVKKEGEVRQRELSALAETVRALEGKRVEIAARATDKGGLFKSIGAADIAKRIGVPEDAVKLEKSLKRVGEHPVTIEAAGAAAHATIAVAAS